MSLHLSKIAMLFVLCLASRSLISESVSGADDFQPLSQSETVERAKMLAPFIDEQTIAVARFDAEQVSADELKRFAELVWPGKRLNEGQPVARFVDDFKQAGGSELYLIAYLSDIPDRAPIILAPLSKKADEKSLSAVLASLPHYGVCQRQGGVLICGSRESLDRVAGATATSRPELQRALQEAGNTQFQILVTPSASMRKVTEELLPTLPKSLGGGPARTFTRGALWVALSGNLSPRPHLRLSAQAEDPAAAIALRAQWRDTLVRIWPQGASLIDALTPEAQKNRLTLDLNADRVEKLMLVLRPELQAVGRFGRRQQSVEHLKQIGLAMHTYFDVYKHFPPPALAAADGKPLLSWRVAILPYLGQEALYKEFHFDEAWDSEHNRKLIERMPEVYRSLDSAAGEGRTCYVVPVGQGSAFEGHAGIGIPDITDGTSNTLMALEMGDEQAVTWTRPDDFSFDRNQPSAGLTSPYPDGKLFLLCDGSVHFITQSLDDETLRRFLMRNDGNPVPQID